ncbi:hypothetical protein TrRE_jg10744 [Triparma retinervis]|uniref:FZ domain-containing protein n=1 Tax=Triparma retinervis TaxID=2557542 RepID=A0A9W7FEA5_9STRA|nr:hypothetical protein TrRE_jg10744 [Triparma retinervis]
MTSSRQLSQCELSCNVPDVVLPHCGSVIAYSVCQTSDRWQTMDDAFPSSMAALGLDADEVKAEAGGGDKCAGSILNLHCKNIFPACEIGTEVRPLCESACLAVLEECKDSKFSLPPTMCDDMLELSSSAQCVGLSYIGANHVLWIAGFSIGLAFSFLAALGLNLQKLSMNREALKPESVRRPTIRQPLWVIGLSLITSGSLLDFVAFGMAPQSLLAPLGALSLVWNLLIAPLFNAEKLTRQNMIATGIIIFGTLLTVIFAAHSTPTYTLDDLMSLYTKPVMVCYMILVVSFLVTMATKLKKIEEAIKEEEGGGTEAAALVDAMETGRDSAPSTPSKRKKLKSSAYDLAKMAMKTDKSAIVSDKNQVHTEMNRIVCYGGLAGCFGGLSVLLAKSTAELVKNVMTGSETGAFDHPQPYLIVLCMAMCLLSQITILNSGLSKFNALLMVPVYQSFWNMFSTLGGIVYFQEYRDLHTFPAIFFLTGILTTLGGVFYLLKERVDGIDAPEGSYEPVDDDDDRASIGTASVEENPNEDHGAGLEWLMDGDKPGLQRRSDDGVELT